MAELSRRQLLKGSGLALVAVAAPLAQGQGAKDASAQNALIFFNEPEAKFVDAAIDRLIPADDTWGGAQAAGVLNYIDRQLAGAYGSGARLYLKGPWNPDAPAQQGYQLRYAPAQLYRIGIGEAREQIRARRNGQELWQLPPDEIDAELKALEHGEIELPSLPGSVFFETLLANTIEGFFSDPAYGGNRDMISWRMVGFPGAYASYADLVDKFGYDFKREPLSIAASTQDSPRQRGV